MAENLGDVLLAIQTLDNLKVLVVIGNLNREVIVKELEEKGHAIVNRLKVYETQFDDVSKEAATRHFLQKVADVIIFMSSSTVKSFAKQASVLQLETKTKILLFSVLGQ